jgi:hypothetical protein
MENNGEARPAAPAVERNPRRVGFMVASWVTHAPDSDRLELDGNVSADVSTLANGFP